MTRTVGWPARAVMLAIALIGASVASGPRRGLAQGQPAANAEPAPTFADCSRDYHAELSRISTQRILPASDALVAARRAEAGLPGRWLLGPYARSGKSSPRPVASEQGLEVFERVVCVRPAPRGPAADESGACLQEERRRGQRLVVLDPLGSPTPDRPRNVARQEQALYYFADPIVKAAGQMPQLLPQTQLGAIGRRVAADLRGYTGQAAHPALCAGAPELLEHLERQAAPLKRHVRAALQAARTAHELAALRMAAVREVAGRDREAAAQGTGDTPASVLVTGAIGTTEAVPLPSLGELMAEAASLILPESERAGLAQLSPLEVLPRLRAASSQGTAVPQPEVVRAALDDALGILEAAAYVGHNAAILGRIGDGLVDGLDAVREAHGRTCQCR